MKKILYLLLFSAVIFAGCEDNKDGCTNANACNFNPLANVENGSCEFICLNQSQKDRVIAFVQSAKNYWTTNGKTAAFAAYDVPSKTFVNQELYIFVIDATGKVLSHGASQQLINSNQYDLRDINGKYIIRAILESVNNTSGKGWSWYQWENPANNNQIGKKFTYAEKFQGLIIAAGTYVN